MEACENIVGKEKNTNNQHFRVFLQFFNDVTDTNDILIYT